MPYERFFEKEGTASNTLNREVLLHNISYICSAMSTYVRSWYGSLSRLFVTGEKSFHHQKGQQKEILLLCQHMLWESCHF